MISIETVKEKALELARTKLGDNVKTVVVADDTDSEGRPSLRVTVILRAQWSTDPPGAALNAISRDLNVFLSSRNDERFAYTHYMTSKEFASSHDRPKATIRGRRATG